MSQQTWIAVSLLIGFIVFITLRGEASMYLDLAGLGLPPATGVGG